MTKQKAIRIWLERHPEPAATPDSIAWNVCFWLRVKVDKYDVIAIRGQAA